MTGTAVEPPRADEGGPAKLPRRRLRGVLSVLLMVLASLTAMAGGVTLYAHEEIVNNDAFVDRATDALQQPAVQRAVSREISVQLLEPALPDAVAARPLIQSAVKLAIGSEAFRGVFRLAVRHAQRLLFDPRGGNGAFDIANAGTVVTSALKTLAPKIASKIPRNTEAVLLTIRRRSFAGRTLRAANAVRVLGIVLPFVALGLFALAIAVAPVRRMAITRSGVGLGTAALALVIALELGRRYVTAHVMGPTELSRADVRGAVGELWGAYLDDLTTWALGVALVAYLVAAASSSVLAPYSAVELLRRVRALAARPRSRRVRAIVAVLALVVGIFVVVKPTLSLRIAAVAGGCLLFYYGLGELLTVTAPAAPRWRRQWRNSRRRGAEIAAAAAAVAAGLIVAFILTGASPTQARSGTCNGYAALCSRRLDEVAFAGVHNSMSAADSPGWFIANQDRDINQQLQDGIRAFKISTHYGTEGRNGLVHTDILAAGDKLNRVAEKLVPQARAALQRFSLSLGRNPPGAGKRDIWLCHTLCELGATRMLTYFETIRNFLQANPNQVLVFFNEDYVRESELRDVFVRAGVFRYLARLTPGQPLPTLGQLIAEKHNIVIFAQEPTSGKYPWNPYAFGSWIQDTPLGAKTKPEFTCKLNRGRATNPILMMNNWADIFPPRPLPNVPLVQQNFILQRSRQCDQQRGRIPNLILTDFYNRGDVVGAAATLNGVEAQPPPRLAPFEPASS